MLNMLRSMLGEQAFLSAVTLYLTENEYSSTVSRDLWKHFEKPASTAGLFIDVEKMTVENMMETWVNNSGFPEVNIVRNFDNNTVTVYQYKFQWEWPASHKEETAMLWPLWVTYHSPGIKGATGGKLLPVIRSQEMDLPKPLHEEPVVFNKEARSYFRVRYDAKSLCKLAKLLRENHTRMSVVERAQLQEDLSPLAMPNPKCKPCGSTSRRNRTTFPGRQPWVI